MGPAVINTGFEAGQQRKTNSSAYEKLGKLALVVKLLETVNILREKCKPSKTSDHSVQGTCDTVELVVSPIKIVSLVKILQCFYKLSIICCVF